MPISISSGCVLHSVCALDIASIKAHALALNLVLHAAHAHDVGNQHFVHAAAHTLA